MDSVAFGIDRRWTPDRELLAALATVAAKLDARPKDLLCVFADRASDVQWFTFRATSWARDAVLPAQLFLDELRKANVTFVAVARDENVPSDVAITACTGGEVAVEVRSDGFSNAVLVGVADEAIERVGDAESFTFAAIHWETRVPWNGFTDGSPRVALRRDYAAVPVPAVELGGTPLPPVCVVRTAEESFGLACERAIEVFSVRRRTGATLVPPIGAPVGEPVDAPASASAADDKPAVAAKRARKRPQKKRR